MKLNKLFLMTGLAVMSLMAASCSDDDDWSAGAPSNAQGLNVYIGSSNNIAIPMDGNTFEVTYVRNNTSGALTIPVNFSTPTPEIFTSVPSQVTFNDGEEEATITITCSDEMTVFKTYKATIIVDEQYTTQYADTTANCPRAELNIVKEDYKPFKTGTYYSQFNETEDPGIVLQFSEKKQTYRISVENSEFAHTFTFKVDGEGNIIFQEPSIAQGWAYPGYGDVYAQPATDKPSLYDPEENVYYFGFKYVIPAAGVGFNGTYYDYFVVDAE